MLFFVQMWTHPDIPCIENIHILCIVYTYAMLGSMLFHTNLRVSHTSLTFDPLQMKQIIELNKPLKKKWTAVPVVQM